MTISVNRRQKSKPKYYVYFNDWTGEILSVGNTLRDDTPAPYIETDDVAAQRIIRGAETDKNFVISSDRRNSEQLVRKSEYLQLRKQEDSLFLLPGISLHEWDIRVRLYSQNNMLVIEANRAMITRLIAHNMQREILLDTRIFFDFYIIRKNDPDFMVKIISVDAATLINHGKVALSIDSIIPYVNLNNIDILTRRYFENYSFEVLDDRFIDSIDQEQELLKNQLWQHVYPNTDAHIDFKQTGNQIEVSSIVSAEQLTNVGMHQRKMPFYIVGDTPDEYLAQLSIDISKLRMGQKEKFAVDFDIMDANILYHNPALKVNKRRVG